MPLQSLQLLRVAGRDRHAFLQGQLTQDLRSVAASCATRYAWADAQGRVLVVGELFAWNDAYWLTVPAALAEATARRLRLFVLRAQVTIEPAACSLEGRRLPAGAAGLLQDCELPVRPLTCAATGDWCALRVDAERLLLAAAAPALPELLAAVPGDPVDSGAWTLADIRAGFARLESAAGAYIPQMLNLDLAGAVSFDKGCYPGQEIITRTRHLGRLKRRLFRFAADSPPLVPGDPLFAAGGECGTVLLAAPAATGSEVLAVLRLDAAANPVFADAELHQPLLPRDLPYEIPGIIPGQRPA